MKKVHIGLSDSMSGNIDDDETFGEFTPSTTIFQVNSPLKEKESGEVNNKPLSAKDILRHILVFCHLLGFTVAYTYFFSAIGLGIKISKWTRDNYTISRLFLGIAFLLSFLLFLSNSNKWKNQYAKYFRVFIISVVVICVVGALLSSMDSYPYAPICVYLLLIPVISIAIHIVFESIYRWPFEKFETNGKKINKQLSQVEEDAIKAQSISKSILHHISSLRIHFILLGLVLFFWWGVWIFKEEQRWTTATRRNMAVVLGCESGDEEGEEYNCLPAFLLWVAPFAESFCLFTYAYICNYIGSEQEIGRKFALIFIFILFIFWVAASFGGAGSGLTEAFFALAFAMFMSLGVLGFMIYNGNIKQYKEVIRHSEGYTGLLNRFGNYVQLLQGLLIITCSPFIIIYFLITIAKRQMKNTYIFLTILLCKNEANGDSGGRSDSESEEDDNEMNQNDEKGEKKPLYPLMTTTGRRYLNAMRAWSWTSVLKWAIFWGVLFQLLNVIVSKFTVLILSILIERCKDLSLASVTVILFVTGWLLFMCPPVPGVPIYLTGGILVIAVTKDTWGVTFGVLYTIVFSLILKLTACASQQKLVGEALSGNVYVRKFCQVNTQSMRITRLVLEEKGLSIPKCTLLVGMPDFPISCLCGILKIPLIPVLYGTLPTVFLITPTVLSGTFMYLSGLDTDSSTMATLTVVFLTVTAAVQGGSIVVAAVFLDRELHNPERIEKLESLPIDQEVEDLIQKEERKKLLYIEKTQWKYVPCFWRFILILSLMLMTFACYLVQLFPASCYADFELTDTVDDALDGDWKKLVKPLGMLSIICFLLSFLLYYVYEYGWAVKQVANLQEKHEMQFENPCLSEKQEVELVTISSSNDERPHSKSLQ